MGRVLKRVPLDFNWPLNQVWKGYLNPYSSQKCKSCGCSGLNPETKKLSDDWYTHLRTDGLEGWGHHLEQEDVQALIDADRLWDFTRKPRTPEQAAIVKKKIDDGGNSWLPKSNGYIPTAQEVNEWNKKGMGHDGINQWICVEARAMRMGIYGECEFCKGDGFIFQSEKIKELHETWESFEPPIGDGYQVWETVSEGSPISPVFATPEELAKHMSGTTWGADHGTSYETWLRFIVGNGYSVSGKV